MRRHKKTISVFIGAIILWLLIYLWSLIQAFRPGIYGVVDWEDSMMTFSVPTPEGLFFTGVLPEQLGDTYKIWTLMFQFVLQPNKRVDLWDVQHSDVRFAGVRVRDTQQANDTWSIFYRIRPAITPEWDQIFYNPLMVFSADNNIFVDIGDDRADATKDWNLVRLYYNMELRKWIVNNCYGYKRTGVPTITSGLMLPYTLSYSNECFYTE
jgi:hypothetical protein